MTVIIYRILVIISILLISHVLNPTSIPSSPPTRETSNLERADFQVKKQPTSANIDKKAHSPEENTNLMVLLIIFSGLYRLIYVPVTFSWFQVIVGFFGVSAGVRLRLASFHALGPLFTFHLQRQAHGHPLIQRGPYKYIKHPGYFGMFGALFGYLILLSDEPIILGVGFICLLGLLLLRTIEEEKFMEKEFPLEYPSYSKEKFRFIPSVY